MMISKLILKFLPFGVCILDIFLTRHRYSLYNKEKGCRLKTEHVYRRMCRKELHSRPELLSLGRCVWKACPWPCLGTWISEEFLPFLPDKSGSLHPKWTMWCIPNAWSPSGGLELLDTRERAPTRPVLSESAATAALILSVYGWRSWVSALWLTGVSLLEAGVWLPQLCPMYLFPLLRLLCTLHCKYNCMLSS